jgi:hypothetical protein
MNDIPTERRPFVAPFVDEAAKFIKERGAVMVGELAEFLTDAGVDVRGDEELTGEDLARTSRRDKFSLLDVIASGSPQFLRITAALLINRAVSLDAANPALVKLRWAGRDAPCRLTPSVGAHYHILTVRDPGGSQQVAECWEADDSLGFLQQFLEEVVLSDSVDEGWDAFYIVGCGPDRCRHAEIGALPVEEWGAPYWARADGPDVTPNNIVTDLGEVVNVVPSIEGDVKGRDDPPYGLYELVNVFFGDGPGEQPRYSFDVQSAAALAKALAAAIWELDRAQFRNFLRDMDDLYWRLQRQAKDTDYQNDDAPF